MLAHIFFVMSQSSIFGQITLYHYSEDFRFTNFKSIINFNQERNLINQFDCESFTFVA